MMQSPALAFLPLVFTALLLAQPAEEAASRPSLENLAAAIQSELASHGDRVLGNGLYGWSTRLSKIEGCRAELSVRVTSNTGDPSVRTETVNFSLGAIEPSAVALQKNRLDLFCANRKNCIASTSTCSTTSKGIVIDCGTQGQKRSETFSLEFDGDVAAAARLERAVLQAVELCRVPASVTF